MQAGTLWSVAAGRNKGLQGAYKLATASAKVVQELSVEQLLEIWEQTGVGVARELHSGLSVSLPPLGVFERRTRPTRRGVVLLISDDYLIEHELLAADPRDADMVLLSLSNAFQDFEGFPRHRLSVSAVARAIGIADVDLVQYAIASMLTCMGQLMRAEEHVQITFAPVGDLTCHKNIILFHSTRKRVPFPWDSLESPTTVRKVMHVQDHHDTMEAQQLKQQPDQALQQRQRAAASESPRSCRRSPPRNGDARDGLRAALVAKPEDIATRAHQQAMPPASIEFPPLLERWGRTLATAHVGAQDPGSASHRIGSSSSGSAAWLSCRLTPALYLNDQNTDLKSRPEWKRGMRWWADPASDAQLHMELTAAARPAIAKRSTRNFGAQSLEMSPLIAEGQECGLSLQEIQRTLQRYEFYVKNGVPDQAVSPINPDWLQNVLRSVRVTQSARGCTSDQLERLLHEMCDEARASYMQAMKKAIVDHILTNDPRARFRVSILFVPNAPPLWGHHLPLARGEGEKPKCRPQPMPSRAKQALARSLRSTQVMLKLLDVSCTQDVDTFLLVDLPQKSEQLLHLQEFCERQTKHRQAVKESLELTWLPAVRSAISSWMSEESEGPEKLEAHRRTAILDAAVARLSTKVRGIVENSVRAYKTFFDRFASEKPNCPAEAIQLMDSMSEQGFEDAFMHLELTSLGEGDASCSFSTCLRDLSCQLLTSFDDTASCLEGLSVKVGDGEDGENAEEERLLWQAGWAEELVSCSRARIEEIIHRNLTNIESCVQLYEPYKHILQAENRALKLVESFTMSPEEFMDEVIALGLTKAAVSEKCPKEIQLQLVSINCRTLNELLQDKANQASNSLVQGILQNVLNKNDILVRRFEAAVNKMIQKASTEAELLDLEQCIRDFRRVGMQDLRDECANIGEWLTFIFKCEERLPRSLLSSTHFHSIYDGAQRVSKIGKIVREREANLRLERETCEVNFQEEREAFVEHLASLHALIAEFKELGDKEQDDEYLDRLEILKGRFVDAHAEAEKLNDRERRLGLEVSAFPELMDGEQAIEPFYQLWVLVQMLEDRAIDWTETPLSEMDVSKVEFEVEAMQSDARDLVEHFVDAKMPIPARVAMELEGDLGSFMDKQVALLDMFLLNSCLQQRHWALICSITGLDINPEDHGALSLGELFRLGVEEHVPELLALSEAAKREKDIEQSLQELRAQWQPVMFTLHPWRHTGTYVVASSCVEEVQALVEEQLLRTHSMCSSPHAAPWLTELEEWQTRLEETASLVECWLQVQAAWAYLEPLFSGRLDLLRQMPNEHHIFWRVDRVWRRFMALAKKEEMALNVTRDAQLRMDLEQCCEWVEQVQHGLNDYLEAERLAFPRFFFVSSENLLQILAASQDLSQVQPHLCHCFEGMNGICLSEDGRAVGMIAADGEQVDFQHPVREGKSAKDLFRALLVAMRTATRKMCLDAVHEQQSAACNGVCLHVHGADSAGRTSRWSWALCIPLQAALCASSIWCAQEVSSRIVAQQLTPLAHRLELEMRDLMLCLREQSVPGIPDNSVSKFHFEQLLLLWSYHREAVNQLVENNVESPNDFDWLAHLRLEVCVGDESASSPSASSRAPLQSGTEPKMDIVAQIAGARIEYGYEYVGTCSRLMMTPLTQRAFLSLASAQHLRSVSLVVGPTGVGKTETIRELAVTLGKYCVVSRCSGQQLMPRCGIERSLKGMAATGAWCCLAGLQNFDSDALHELAVHVVSVQQALSLQTECLELAGSFMNLKFGCHLILSATTARERQLEGLAQTPFCDRLPEQLLHLCRPLSMVSADVAVVVEAKLLLAGFTDPAAAARKLLNMYRTQQAAARSGGEESDPHRLPELLRVVGAARRNLTVFRSRNSGDDVMGLALYRACADIWGPGHSADSRVREGLRELMPAALKSMLMGSERRFAAVKKKFRECIESQGLQSIAGQEEKAVELHAMSLLQRGVLMVGPAYAGKTTCLRSLATAVGVGTHTTGGGSLSRPISRAADFTTHLSSTDQHHAATDRQSSNIAFVTLHPKAYGMDALYGQTRDATQTWEDGIIASVLKALAARRSETSEPSLTTWSNTQALGLLGPGDAATIAPAPRVRTPARGDLQDLRSIDAATFSPRLLQNQQNQMVQQLSGPAVLASVSVPPEDNDEMEVHKWIHFDGPIEASWTETLHALLESGVQALRLPGGHALPAPSGLQLFFEAANLHSASPGTVARCGIVPFNAHTTPSSEIGHGPSKADIIASWMHHESRGDGCLATLGNRERQDVSQAVEGLSRLVDAAKKQLLFICSAQSEQLLIQGSLSWLSQVLRPLKEKAIHDHICERGAHATSEHIYACAALAGIWAVGNVVAAGAATRKAFDAVLRQTLQKGQGPKLGGACLQLPTTGLCFDYAWDDEVGRWCPWLHLMTSDTGQRVPGLVAASNVTAVGKGMLYVHTPHSSPFLHLAAMACRTNTQLLLCGPHGAGKSSCMNEVMRGLDEASFLVTRVVFAAATTAADIQASVGGALEEQKHRVSGPPLGMSKAVIFLDDLSLPVAEQGLAGEAPLELVRQFCCEGGWHACGDSSASLQVRPYHFQRLVDTFAMATAGPSTWKSVSPRLIRHFQVLQMSAPDVEDIRLIFGTISQPASAVLPSTQSSSFSGGAPLDADSDVRAALSAAAASLYFKCSQTFSQEPAHPHYVFGLGDVTRAAMGMCLPLLSAASLKADTSESWHSPPPAPVADDHRHDLMLWLHEHRRVFADRMVNDESRRQMFDSVVRQSVAEASWDPEMIEEMDACLSQGCYFALGLGRGHGAPAGYSAYPDLTGPEEMLAQRLRAMSRWTSFLSSEAHGESGPLLFSYAVEHVLRIMRAMTLPEGHVVLLGQPGSGRVPLAKLAVYVANQLLVEMTCHDLLERESWLSKLRKLLSQCHSECDRYACLLYDVGNSHADEECLSTVHSLISGGECPGLMTKDDQANVVELVETQKTARKAAQQQAAQQADYLAMSPRQSMSTSREAHLPMSPRQSISIRDAHHGMSPRLSQSPRDAHPAMSPRLSVSTREAQQLGKFSLPPAFPGAAKGAGKSTSQEHLELSTEPQQQQQQEACDKAQRSWPALRLQFLQQCRLKLRVALVMPSEPAALRRRFRALPALLHASTLDWFDPWPQDALIGVADRVLTRMCVGTEEVLNHAKAGCSVLAALHGRVISQASRLAAAIATPSSPCEVAPVTFLTLVRNYGRIFLAKHDELTMRLNQRSLAITCLDGLSSYIQELQTELDSMVGEVHEAKRRKAAVLARHSAEEKEMLEICETADLAAARVAAAAEEVERVETLCAEEDRKANVCEEKARALLQALKVDDFDRALEMSKAGEAIVNAIAAIVPRVSLAGPPAEVLERLSGRSIDDEEGVAPESRRSQRRESDGSSPEEEPVHLLHSMRDRPMSAFSAAGSAWQQARDALEADGVDILLAPQSGPSPVATLYRWLKVALEHRDIFVQYEALMESASQARSVQAELQAEADVERRRAEEAKAEAHKVEMELNDVCTRCSVIEERVSTSTVKMERGIGLQNALAGSKPMLLEEQQRLLKSLEGVSGDAVLAAAAITHLGTFPANERSTIKAAWLDITSEAGLWSCEMLSQNSSGLAELLLGPHKAGAQLSAWAAAGLPECDSCKENALIMLHSERPALCLDPHGQAVRWLRGMESQNKLKVASALNNGWASGLEQARLEGHPVLLEDLTEAISQETRCFLHSVTNTLEDMLGPPEKVGPGSQQNAPQSEPEPEPRRPPGRLYIASRLFKSTLPAIWHSRVVLVDFTMTSEAFEHELVRIAAACEAHVSQVPAALPSASHASGVHSHEAELLVRTLASVGDMLAGSELVEALWGVELTTVLQQSGVKSGGSAKALKDEIESGEVLQGAAVAALGSAAAGTLRSMARSVSNLFFALQPLLKVRNFYHVSANLIRDLFEESCKAVYGSASSSVPASHETLAKRVHEQFMVRICRSLARSAFDSDRLRIAVVLSMHLGSMKPTPDQLHIHPVELTFLMSLMQLDAPEMSVAVSATKEEETAIVVPAELQSLSTLAELPPFQPLQLLASESKVNAWQRFSVELREASLKESTNSGGIMQMERRLVELVPGWSMLRTSQRLLIVLCLDEAFVSGTGMAAHSRQLLERWCEEMLGEVAARALLSVRASESFGPLKVAEELVTASLESKSRVLVAMLSAGGRDNRQLHRGTEPPTRAGATLPTEELAAVGQRHGWERPQVVTVARQTARQLAPLVILGAREGRWIILQVCGPLLHVGALREALLAASEAPGNGASLDAESSTRDHRVNEDEEQQPPVHQNFRLWITLEVPQLEAMTSEEFALLHILDVAPKVMVELPMGMSANINALLGSVGRWSMVEAAYRRLVAKWEDLSIGGSAVADHRANQLRLLARLLACILVAHSRVCSLDIGVADSTPKRRFSAVDACALACQVCDVALLSDPEANADGTDLLDLVKKATLRLAFKCHYGGDLQPSASAEHMKTILSELCEGPGFDKLPAFPHMNSSADAETHIAQLQQYLEEVARAVLTSSDPD